MICLASALVLCGCGKKEEAPVPSAQTAETPAVSTEPAVNTPDAPVPETPEPEPELITLEEFRESNEAVTGTDLFGVHILELNSGDKHIYGQLYLPTEDKQSYPLVIISHGIQGSYYDLVDQAGKCVDAGMAAYIFDYCGGSTYSRSSGDISDMSILTECDDLEFVLNELWQYAFMDRENTYLMGESQGGMVSALLAAERPQDIAGMVLLYPAFNIPDMAREVYVEGQIPEELYKAAKVDGTSDFKYLWKVMIPICQPTMVTIAILKVIECWNSYVWPRLITDDEAYFLVSNGIQEIRENGFGRENIPAMMAAVVVISIPLIVLFLIFHKKIMAGVSRGGTKG
jgi:pimeloyl-ACP methyl ester carboxylesterase